MYYTKQIILKNLRNIQYSLCSLEDLKKQRNQIFQNEQSEINNVMDKINNYPEYKKLREAKGELNAAGNKKTYILKIGVYLVVIAISLLIPLLTKDAIQNHILKNQPDVNVDILQEYSSTVLQNAYFVFLTLFVLLFSWMFIVSMNILKTAFIYNPELIVTSFIALIIFLMRLISVLGSGIGFWNILYGIFWPIVDVFKGIGVVFLSLFGYPPFDYFGIALIVSIFIVISYGMGFFIAYGFLDDYVAKLVYPDIVESETERLTKQLDIVHEEFNKRKEEIDAENARRISEINKKYKKEYAPIDKMIEDLKHVLSCYKKDGFWPQTVEYDLKIIKYLIWYYEHNPEWFSIEDAIEWVSQKENQKYIDNYKSYIPQTQHQNINDYDDDDDEQYEIIEEEQYYVRDGSVERKLTRDVGNPCIWYDGAGNKYYSGNDGKTFEEW